MNQTKATIDHDEIRSWAEARGATPARVKRTGGRGDVGLLRLDFPGYSGKDTLEEISWDEFFEKFDESQLALVYRENLARGGKSNFNKLVGRETVDFGAHSGRRTAPARRRAKAASPRGATTRGASKRAATRTSAKSTATPARGTRPKRATKAGTTSRTAAAPKRSASKRTTARSGTTKRAPTKRGTTQKSAARRSARG